MPKLFENLSVQQLQTLLVAGDADAPLRHLSDPVPLRRAKRLAKVNGIDRSLDREFDPTTPIDAFSLSEYRKFKLSGSRVSDQFFYRRSTGIKQAALALWLGHPKASLSRLQDLLWAVCDDYTWVGAAHEIAAVDLGSTMMGAMLCEVLAAVGHRLDQEVTDRVRAQIEARVLAIRDHPSNWWRKSHHNWNHVCNGNTILCALFLWHNDPKRQAELIHRCVVDMQLALDGFTDDGGCVEGPGYWCYGFSHYMAAAEALFAYTRGRIDLMKVDPKIERISRYPLATHIEADRQAPFADTSHFYMPARVALELNRRMKIPELYALCRTHADGTLQLRDWHELTTYEGEKAPKKQPPGDALLSDLGLARMRSAPGKRQLTVLAVAGNNGVNHNHNDIGSFVAYRDGVEFLTDPGAPIYSQKTFSDRRYEIIFCNSLGHSVPKINGMLQATGKEFFGTIAAEQLNTHADKTIRIEMARAYPEELVAGLTRTLKLDYKLHRLSITDVYHFKWLPRALVETFITFEHVKIAPDQMSVTIRSGTKTATLAAMQPGRFTVVAETEASKEGRSGRILKRILFAPRKITPETTLTFEFS